MITHLIKGLQLRVALTEYTKNIILGKSLMTKTDIKEIYELCLVEKHMT